jgi:hypothetical protein
MSSNKWKQVECFSVSNVMTKIVMCCYLARGNMTECDNPVLPNGSYFYGSRGDA